MLTGSSTDELDSDEHMLAELEETFKDRYTESDAEYQAAISEPTPPPPVVIPWTGRSKRKHDWSRDRSNWNRRGGYRDNYRNSYRGGGGGGGGGRDDYGHQKYRRVDEGRNYNRDNYSGSRGSRYQDSGPYQDGRYQNLGRYQELGRYRDQYQSGRNSGFHSGQYDRADRRQNDSYPYRRT